MGRAVAGALLDATGCTPAGATTKGDQSRGAGIALFYDTPMSNAQSAIHLETLEYKDEKTVCVGTLVHDNAFPGRLPGVVLCPTFWGADALARRKATQIARLGYSVLVMDPYGDGKVAADRAEASALMTALLADPNFHTGTPEADQRLLRDLIAFMGLGDVLTD